MSDDAPDAGFRAGFAAVVGRPSVGKSTLVNALVGQKLCITSPIAQTTRHRILGVSTRSDFQVVYVDTPGMHRGGGRLLNRRLNRTASGALEGVDVAVVVIEALRWGEEDAAVLEMARARAPATIVAINKIDTLEDKKALLPFLAELGPRCAGAELVPVSARTGDGLADLEALVVRHLPRAEALFPSDQVTDRSERFLVAEIVREKLLRRLRDEVPHRLAVETERFDASGDVVRLEVVIWVERPGQKAIVIGHQGRVLKAVGREARVEIEALLERRVFLELWVKVLPGWTESESAIRRFGYEA